MQKSHAQFEHICLLHNHKTFHIKTDQEACELSRVWNANISRSNGFSAYLKLMHKLLSNEHKLHKNRAWIAAAIWVKMGWHQQTTMSSFWWDNRGQISLHQWPISSSAAGLRKTLVSYLIVWSEESDRSAGEIIPKSTSNRGQTHRRGRETHYCQHDENNRKQVRWTSIVWLKSWNVEVTFVVIT